MAPPVGAPEGQGQLISAKSSSSSPSSGPLTATQAGSVGSLAAGSTVAVIFVELRTLTLVKFTDPLLAVPLTVAPLVVVPLPGVTVTWAAGQDAVALAGVVKPVPVITMSEVFPATQVPEVT